jgi:hypothetical protein
MAGAVAMSRLMFKGDVVGASVVVVRDDNDCGWCDVAALISARLSVRVGVGLPIDDKVPPDSEPVVVKKYC